MGKEEAAYKKHLKRLVYSLAELCPIKPRNGAEAAALCRVLHGHQVPCTLGKLSRYGDDPSRIVGEYQSISQSMKGCPGADGFYLSLKPPAVQFQARLANAVAATAFENGHNVHFDAHGFIFAEATLKLLKVVMENNASATGGGGWKFGLTIPSRWKRSALDARWAAEKGVRPRLVKGDFPAPYLDEVEPVQGFLALVDQLAGAVPELALATHDALVAREAVARCRERGTAVQLELFFGMPTGEMLALARELAVPVRFYVPFGDTLLLYQIRDLLANPHKIFRRSSLERLGSQEAKLARIIRQLQVQPLTV